MLIRVTVSLWTAKNITSWHLPFWERDPLRKNGNCKTRRDTALTLSQHGVQARLRRQSALRKPHHSATPTWHASPATACKPHHDPNPPLENLATSTQRSSPATPTRCTRAPLQRHPPRHHAKASPPTRRDPAVHIAGTAHFL